MPRSSAGSVVSAVLDRIEKGEMVDVVPGKDVRGQYVARSEGHFVKPEVTSGPGRNVAIDMGYEYYTYKYKETVDGDHFMDLTGKFHGLYGSLVAHSGPGSVHESELVNFYALEARMAWASLDYNGGVSDGAGFEAPLTLSGVPDMVIETRGLFGKDFYLPGQRITPYSGFGFRFLRDDSSDIEGVFDYYGAPTTINGYKRTSEYYYLPVGLEIAQSLSNDLSAGIKVEYDHLFFGIQKSYIETALGKFIENRQKRGYGLRASVRLEKEFGSYSLMAEPFVRTWNIKESEWSPSEVCVPGNSCWGMVEPDNVTREIGLRLGMAF